MTTNPSTRLNIVMQTLHDSLERLSDMPPTMRVRELRMKVQLYERAVRKWPTQPPTEDERQAMVKSVIEMNMEIMALRKTASE